MKSNEEDRKKNNNKKHETKWKETAKFQRGTLIIQWFSWVTTLLSFDLLLPSTIIHMPRIRTVVLKPRELSELPGCFLNVQISHSHSDSLNESPEEGLGICIFQPQIILTNVMLIAGNLLKGLQRQMKIFYIAKWICNCRTSSKLFYPV